MKGYLGLIIYLCWLSVATVLGFVSPDQADAGRLVIDVSGRSELVGERVRAVLSVTNRGDEAALDIQAEAPGQYPVPKSLMVQRLEPGQTIELDLSWARPGPKPGTYIKVSMVNFQDSINRPFTAPAEVRFNLGQETASPVMAESKQVSLADRRMVRVKLWTKEKEPMDLRVTVFTPKELSAAEIDNPIRLTPGRVKTISFDLWNLSGMSGSTYPIMLLLEHESKGRHAAKVIKVMAFLKGRKNFVTANLEWWLAAIGAVMGFILAIQFGTRRRP